MNQGGDLCEWQGNGNVSPALTRGRLAALKATFHCGRGPIVYVDGRRADLSGASSWRVRRGRGDRAAPCMARGAQRAVAGHRSHCGSPLLWHEHLEGRDRTKRVFRCQHTASVVLLREGPKQVWETMHQRASATTPGLATLQGASPEMRCVAPHRAKSTPRIGSMVLSSVFKWTAGVVT